MHDLRLLTVLREVALRGSFSAAAEALAYTQPAVSQQIARLEKQVGVKLIEREPRGIRLTPAGEVLVRHTERILAQLAAADEELQEVAAMARGRLRIGSFATAAGTIVPRAVAAFRRLRPAIEVDIALLDPHESIPALRHGDIEIAITEEGGFDSEADTTGLQVEHLLDDHMWVSLPADHPLATRHAIELADLREEDWMFACLSGTCADSNVVLRACQDAGFQPRIAYQSDDYFAIQGLVASGMGVALIPGLGLASTREDVAVRRVKGRPPYRRVAAITAGDLDRRRDPDDARVPARRRRGLRRVRARRGRLSRDVGPEGPVVAARVAGLEVARPVVLVEEVGHLGAGLAGTRVDGLDVGRPDVDRRAGGAQVLGRRALEVVAAAPEHDHRVAEPQLGVRDRAVGVLVALGRFEAERLEPGDRRGGVVVAECGIAGHAAQARPGSAPRLERL